MKFPDFGGFFRALAKACADAQANKPRSPVPTTGAGLLVRLTALQVHLPGWLEWAQDNPGDITAADDFLEFFEAQGATWAAPARAALDATPNGMIDAETYLPTILWVMTQTTPAATGIQGDDHSRGRG